jgi:hypothetical protein
MARSAILTNCESLGCTSCSHDNFLSQSTSSHPSPGGSPACVGNTRCTIWRYFSITCTNARLNALPRDTRAPPCAHALLLQHWRRVLSSGPACPRKCPFPRNAYDIARQHRHLAQSLHKPSHRYGSCSMSMRTCSCAASNTWIGGLTASLFATCCSRACTTASRWNCEMFTCDQARE